MFAPGCDPERFPLAVSTKGRSGRLKGYGNAIIPQVAAAFIQAFMECVPLEARR